MAFYVTFIWVCNRGWARDGNPNISPDSSPQTAPSSPIWQGCEYLNVKILQMISI